MRCINVERAEKRTTRSPSQIRPDFEILMPAAKQADTAAH